MNQKRLYKIESGKKLSGVCGGFAEYFDIDPSLVRIAWCVFGLFYASGVFAYIIAAIILPYKSEVM